MGVQHNTTQHNATQHNTTHNIPHNMKRSGALGFTTEASYGGAHRLRPPATTCNCPRPLKKIFVHVYRWHNPYTHSPNPSNPPGLPPSVPPSVQCINPLKERHITLVSCTK